MTFFVGTAFSTFREDFVDLDPEDVKTARSSRDYLKGQITRVSRIVEHFPKLNYEYMDFGSFARKTKFRPLDDMDMLVSVSPGANSRAEYIAFNKYRVLITDQACPTWIYTDSNNYLNSTRLLNKFKSGLAEVENYKRAEIKRNNVAVVLNLKSYDWNFDIVPAIPVNDGAGGTSHYLIPDGSGNWMRTDPRIDQRSITSANQKHNGHLLPLMRIIKYWNRRHWPPKNIPSYYLETMLINAFNGYNPMVSVKGNIGLAFTLLASGLLSSCADPKNLGDNLSDSMSWEDRLKVSNSATTMAEYAEEAIRAERKEDHKSAIGYWRKIFPDFPVYG